MKLTFLFHFFAFANANFKDYIARAIGKQDEKDILSGGLTVDEGELKKIISRLSRLKLKNYSFSENSKKILNFPKSTNKFCEFLKFLRFSNIFRNFLVFFYVFFFLECFKFFSEKLFCEI